MKSPMDQVADLHASKLHSGELTRIIIKQSMKDNVATSPPVMWVWNVT